MEGKRPKVRVVLLSDCLQDPDAGGAERNIYELARGLDKDAFEIFVATLDCENTGSANFEKAIAHRVHTFKVKRIYGLSGLLQGFQFIRFLKTNRIDILQTYHFSSDIWGGFYGRLAGVKIIISCRRDMGFWRKKWHDWFYRLISPLVDCVIVVSNAVKRKVQDQERLRENKVKVIFNGVSLEDFEPVPEKSGDSAASGNLAVMCVGNFKPVKGHRYLIEAFHLVCRQHPAVILILIGEDELNGSLEELARRLGIQDKVRFFGKRSDVKDILRIADICVLPSLSEGMSNAILEYMASGKPVVATNVGGNTDNVVEGQTGFLVEPKDPQQMAKALNRLIEDEGLRKSMGRSGRKRAEEEFDVKVMVRRYEKIFLESVSR